MTMTLGLLSNEALSPWVNWSTLAPPLYAGLARCGPTQIIAPPTAHLRNVGGYARAIADAYRSDVLFGMQPSAKVENPLLLVSMARGFVRRASFVIDPWRPALGKIDLAARLQRLETCFIPYREAFETLHSASPGRYHYLPFGIDTAAFDAHAPERDVDVFWMGRRYDPLHRAILDYCDANGLTYLFRERTGFVREGFEIGHLASRARYFVVTPPDLDNADRTGGFSPLVMRYLEGLSAGCRLLGVLPRSGEFERLLPREAILEVAPDGSDFEEKFKADQANSEGWAAVEAARQIVRRDHSWEKRAQEIWAALDR